MRARLLTLFAVLALPVVAAAPVGAGGGAHALCRAFAEGNAIVMRDSCFQGVAHFVRAGSTITVTNEGQMTHNLVAVDGGFGVKELQPGTDTELRVTRPGAYRYYCALHGSANGSGMAGVLVVEDGASLAAARTETGSVAPAASTTGTTTAKASGTAWGWVALGALLLSGAAMCVTLAVLRPRQT